MRQGPAPRGVLVVALARRDEDEALAQFAQLRRVPEAREEVHRRAVVEVEVLVALLEPLRDVVRPAHPDRLREEVGMTADRGDGVERADRRARRDDADVLRAAVRADPRHELLGDEAVERALHLREVARREVAALRQRLAADRVAREDLDAALVDERPQRDEHLEALALLGVAARGGEEQHGRAVAAPAHAEHVRADVAGADLLAALRLGLRRHAGLPSSFRHRWIAAQKYSVNSSISCAGKSAATFWRTASFARSVPKNSYATSSRRPRCLAQNSSKRSASRRLRAIAAYAASFSVYGTSFAAMSKYGSQSSVFRILRPVAATKIDQRTCAFTSHGKCWWSDVTCESGHALAKSIGRNTPSCRSASHELKSHPKNVLIVSVVSTSARSSSFVRKPFSVV